MTLSRQSSAPTAPVQAGLRIAILYKRNTHLDEQVLALLEKNLSAQGFAVFFDRKLAIGVEWAREIEREIRTSDAIIPLLSLGSLQTEMLGFEIEIADEAAQRQNGRPRILPVRIRYDGPLPDLLAGILGPLQYFHWKGPEDDQRLIAELGAALKTIPSALEEKPKKPAAPDGLRVTPRLMSPGAARAAEKGFARSELEPIGGAVPLHSEFYIKRAVDGELTASLTRHDSIVLIKGARQMGKTSLLARGLQQARERGAKVALTDFQKLNSFHLESVQNFFFYLAESLAEQLELSVKPEDRWEERRGPSVNFERYLRREVLGPLNAPLVWGLDEVDRLFSCDFGSEVFGLFRSWHNERALDPAGPWAGLTLAIAYATEAHLFITDLNQSPFNVGTRLTMEDFAPGQVAELNRRYGSPLSEQSDLRRFIALVAGHPFLVRRGLHEITSQHLTISGFEQQADQDEGIFGDHLRRILILLTKDPELLEIVRGILRGRPCPNPESFYRLRSAGVMAGSGPADVHPRCEVYARFLKRHLR